MNCEDEKPMEKAFDSCRDGIREIAKSQYSPFEALFGKKNEFIRRLVKKREDEKND